jgi:hypothetical protein
MDPDAEPVPDLVLHPGDTVTLSGDPHGRPRLTLSDADGNDYADLDCAPAAPDADRWRVTGIRWLGGRVLPVRAEPDADPDTDHHLEPLPVVAPDGAGHTHRHAHHGTLGDVLANGLVVERYDHTHRHAHTTPRDDRAYHADHEH